MSKQTRAALLLVLLVIVAGYFTFAPKQNDGAEPWRQFVAYLPADTELVFVAKEPMCRPKEADSLVSFYWWPTGFQRIPEKLYRVLSVDSKDVTLAVEGARCFRGPDDHLNLGEYRYEGCFFNQFRGQAQPKLDQMMDQAEQLANRSYSEGHYKVYVFEESGYRHPRTTLLVRPQPDLLLISTDKHFLSEVLGRLAKQEREICIPMTSAAWKATNTKSPLWAVRQHPIKKSLKPSLATESTIQLSHGSSMALMQSSSNPLAITLLLEGNEPFDSLFSNIDKSFVFTQDKSGLGRLTLDLNQTWSEHELIKPLLLLMWLGHGANF